MFNIYFLKSFCLGDNVDRQCAAGQATGDNIIWHMHFASWITKATNTHPEYVILIALPLQQWFNECATMLSQRRLNVTLNTYNAYLFWLSKEQPSFFRTCQ
jgi:hypothetical protein